jgi:hypothetical protein
MRIMGLLKIIQRILIVRRIPFASSILKLYFKTDYVRFKILFILLVVILVILVVILVILVVILVILVVIL